MTEVTPFIEDHYASFEHYLSQFIMTRSVSSNADSMAPCVTFLKQLFQQLFDVDVQVIKTNGSPVLVARIDGSTNRDILFYGHYDTMPAGELNQWQTDPFQLTLVNGRYYGRGVGDNKGQLMAQILGTYAYQQLHGQLPFNAIFLMEGEEEQGSVHLAETVKTLKNTLLQEVDLAVVVDGSFSQSGNHVVRLGNRGVLAFELAVKTGQQDNHSGNTGNIMPNAALTLMWCIDQLYDVETQHVRIPHFYDGVPTVTAAEQQLLQQLPYDPRAISHEIGINEALLPDKLTYYTNLMYRPTFNVAGLASGYAGSGIKTIVPHEAVVKIDCRLVGDQDIDQIKAGLEQQLADALKKDEVSLHYISQMPATHTTLSDSQLAVMSQILTTATGKASIEPVMPGSVPNYVWTDILKVPTITVPLANFDQNNHAPNENLTKQAFIDGIKVEYELMHQLLNLFA